MSVLLTAKLSCQYHIVEHAGKLLALEETHLPWEVDKDLNTIGAHDFEGKLKGAMTAHPRVCPETGEMFFFSYSMMGPPYLNYYRVDSSGSLVQSEAIDIPRPVMMHDWNITRNHVVFMDLPIVSDMELAVRQGLLLVLSLNAEPGLVLCQGMDQIQM